ncbi:MAG: hybrid sensor histidine kinase/response regulator [Prochloraceae cyanobacterium]|nr:hybrid sensor histidine kinase/response regulator [Prochloraceae cyanobacterium]
MSTSVLNKTSYILAVDDNPDNLFVIKLALEQKGYNVKLVEDGHTALAQIQKFPPDLILLDVMMPELNGYEVTQKIRADKTLPFIPIILITAHEESSLVKGLDIGADEFIRKPVEIDELQARVRSLLRLKRTIDQRENFVSCLTHDLRTPLVAVDRMLSLIKQGVFGNIAQETDRAIEQIVSSNNNLLDMLNNLLEVHCYEVGEKELNFISFNVKELIEQIIAELRPLATEKGLDLKLNLQQEIAEIQGDRLELRRVFTNLIGNAIKFTDAGSVEVNLDLAVKESQKQFVVEIQDTGIGIKPEDLVTIFDRFRQGNHRRSGNGLGLHLCYQTVKAHQGDIEVSSELGKGTKFSVILPV